MVAVLATVLTAAVAIPADAGAAGVAAARPVVFMASVQATTFDHQMIVLINQARASAGVPAVTEATGLTKLAFWWSSRMDAGATTYKLAHNPNAWTMLTTYGASNRAAWGENVAWSSSTATTAQQIFTAYMNSAGHRANILNRNYHFVGMGSVAGSHGLWNTTEFTDKVQTGQAVVAAPQVSNAPVVSGQFVTDATTRAVYRVAGGAPIYVSNWAAMGGPKPTTLISHTRLSGWSRFPANGTYIRATDTGAVYRIAGGAPLYVASWAPMGGVKPTVDVDPAAIAHGGQTGYWIHLNWYPTSHTFLQGAGTSGIFQVVDGTPIHVTSWASVGGPQPYTVVHQLAITRAGLGGFYNHLK